MATSVHAYDRAPAGGRQGPAQPGGRAFARLLRPPAVFDRGAKFDRSTATRQGRLGRRTPRFRICAMDGSKTTSSAAAASEALIELRRLHALAVKIAENQSATKAMAKAQNLQWAISNAETFQFDHFELRFEKDDIEHPFYRTTNSAKIIRATLGSFMQGKGKLLTGSMHDVLSPGTSTEKRNAAKMNFAVKVQEQIYALTGKKPRLEARDNGDNAIFYE
mmetsp:Transcript_26188/g.73415  ORF Transcript_26188/g.73415 Transcript_26188/m.73415 type:complete len:220 (+) Transcript_26188:266-925(+)|eukprot:CAMPEP_0117648258 /NCGR_PEP_ID=MMETSP0804-20121206/297_1 /TAXON_ID=1074897 /ORGANISM="Tetraselmis astigmatica, Strain CCMP880" /LENGTH=219 /DNA_ID=CAMNT_0005453825 /DNA_START=135 /DNA_END=794 /DNA_ORIENTATION=-